MLVIQMHMLMETEYYLMKSKSILSLCLYQKNWIPSKKLESNPGWSFSNKIIDIQYDIQDQNHNKTNVLEFFKINLGWKRLMFSGFPDDDISYL